MTAMLTANQQRLTWWRKHRLKYNQGLVLAGFLAFIAYCAVGEIFIAPHEEFEVTLFTTAFQGTGYLIMMVVANLFYGLGYVVDRLLNHENTDTFRLDLFNFGYWFSFALPFLIPIILIFKFA